MWRSLAKAAFCNWRIRSRVTKLMTDLFERLRLGAIQSKSVRQDFHLPIGQRTSQLAKQRAHVFVDQLAVGDRGRFVRHQLSQLRDRLST